MVMYGLKELIALAQRDLKEAIGIVGYLGGVACLVGVLMGLVGLN